MSCNYNDLLAFVLKKRSRWMSPEMHYTADHFESKKGDVNTSLAQH
jgi:hypothetical protein